MWLGLQSWSCSIAIIWCFLMGLQHHKFSNLVWKFSFCWVLFVSIFCAFVLADITSCTSHSWESSYLFLPGHKNSCILKFFNVTDSNGITMLCSLASNLTLFCNQLHKLLEHRFWAFLLLQIKLELAWQNQRTNFCSLLYICIKNFKAIKFCKHLICS